MERGATMGGNAKRRDASPRRHHIVPRMIQRNFTNASGHLYVYDKRRPGAGVFATTPTNAFVEKDLNSFERKDGSLNAKLETLYSSLESAVAPIVELIVTSALSGKPPRLAEDPRIVWDSFYYHQQKRAPDAFERLGLPQDFERDLDEFIAQWERDERPLSDKEREEIKTPEAIRLMKQYATVRARASSGDVVMDLLATRGIAIGLIDRPDRSFILGDHPQARMGPTSHLAEQQPSCGCR